MSQFKLLSLLAILHPTTDSQFHQNTIVRCCTLWGAIHAVTFSGTVIGYPLGARGFLIYRVLFTAYIFVQSHSSSQHSLLFVIRGCA